MKKRDVISIIGWYGVVAILLAYALISFNFIKSNSLYYQLLNLTGAVAIVYQCTTKKDYQPGVLNLIWALIALFAIIKIFI